MKEVLLRRVEFSRENDGLVEHIHAMAERERDLLYADLADLSHLLDDHPDDICLPFGEVRCRLIVPYDVEPFDG